jgi:phage gp37-like protein
MDFEQVEDKIIETLHKEVSYVKTVETYAGQLEADIKTLPVTFPAVFVVYGGSTFARVDGPNHQETVDFSVLVAAKGVSNKGMRKDDKGVYEMIKAVLTALTNEDFGLDMEKLRPLRVTPVLITKTMAVYGLDFRTSFDTTYQW